MTRMLSAAAELFHGITGRVVETFEPYTEAAPVAIAAQFLAAFGNAVGRGPHFVIGETVHHLNEFVSVVGKSSRARKGDASHIALRALRDADPEWAANIASGLSSGEGLIHAVRDPVEKMNSKGERIVTDEGASDKRLLVLESEFSGALKQFAREGNVLSNVLRDAWDGKAVLRTLTKNSPTRASGAHISVIAHTTPADLGAYLGNVEAANGLGNRFVFVLTHRAKLLPDPGRAPADAVARLVDEVRETLNFARHVGEIRRTPAAAAVWEHLYPELTREQPGLLGNLLARSEAHVARLSALYALSARRQQVDVEHLQAAVALWEYVEQSTAIIFADRTGDRTADKLLAKLNPGRSMTVEEIRSDIFANHIDKTRLDNALAVLEYRGRVRLVKHQTGGRACTVVTSIERDGVRAESVESAESPTVDPLSTLSTLSAQGGPEL